jgi:hypothetical protein
MIKIVDKIGWNTNFNDLYRGDTFIYEGELYMKVEPFRVENIKYNAVCINDGKLYTFTSCYVEPVEVEATIVKRVGEEIV